MSEPRSIKSIADRTKRKSSNIDLSQYTFGKLPPQAIELEEAVLGAMLIEASAVNTVIEKLAPESFYVPQHQKIYQAIFRLFSTSRPIDILTVSEELKNMGALEEVGGIHYISTLTNKIASSANAEHHAHIITQKFIQRELIRISSETIKGAYEDTTDVFDLLDNVEQDLFQITEKNINKGFESMDRLISQAIKEMKEKIDPESGLTGVPSGFNALDQVTSGWQKSDMIILAARPGMGKTAFVLSMARNAAVDFKQPVAVFSLEMSSLQLVTRLMAAETELEMGKLLKGKLQDYEWEQLHQKIKKLEDAPLFIDDTPAINVFELRAKCRRLKQQHNIQMVIIDYLQLMSGGSIDGSKGPGGNREQEIGTISRALKRIAKELSIPVIALSQLNRSVETRGGDKTPQLSDLRESGSIEQDADMVLFIYRPEYYGLTQDEDGNSMQGVAKVKIAKHRNGELKEVDLKFVAKFAKFENMDDSYFNKFAPMPPAQEITIPSKMNFSKGREDDFKDDVPFDDF
jgi:replicative DNA helicase